MVSAKGGTYLLRAVSDNLSEAICKCGFAANQLFLLHSHMESKRVVLTAVDRGSDLLLISLAVEDFSPEVITALQKALKPLTVVYSTGFFLDADQCICELVVESRDEAFAEILAISLDGLGRAGIEVTTSRLEANQ